jgi:hypothetical protein
MIIDNSYFVNEIFIPHAKPSITDNVIDISNDVISFINLYSQDCLVKCLGYGLFKAFEAELDPAEVNGLKSTANAKWDKLLNGTEYIGKHGKKVYWPGIREKIGDKYCLSFIADYVYYKYEEAFDSSRVGVGNVQELAENAEIVSKTPKVVFAWRRFFSKVVGDYNAPIIYEGEAYSYKYGIGVDWYGKTQQLKSLYQFITDTNNDTPGTYPEFEPYMFVNKNQFNF